jgi:polyhydroxyalkanoate synthesis regulator phasin
MTKPLQISRQDNETNHEIERRVQNLVESGEVTSEEGDRLRHLLIVSFEEPEEISDSESLQPESTESVTDPLIGQMLEQLDRLEAELEELRR